MTTEQALRDALQLIADTDPVDAALDPERAARIARAALSQPQAAPADGETLNAPSDDDSMFTIHECLRLADVWSQCDLDAAPQWRTVVYVLAREVRKMLSAPSVAEPPSDQDAPSAVPVAEAFHNGIDLTIRPLVAFQRGQTVLLYTHPQQGERKPPPLPESVDAMYPELRERDSIWQSRVEELERERDALREHCDFLEDKGIEQLEMDAKRYRWLRDNPWPPELEADIALHRNARWDSEIDAAMAATQEEQKDVL